MFFVFSFLLYSIAPQARVLFLLLVANFVGEGSFTNIASFDKYIRKQASRDARKLFQIKFVFPSIDHASLSIYSSNDNTFQITPQKIFRRIAPFLREGLSALPGGKGVFGLYISGFVIWSPIFKKKGICSRLMHTTNQCRLIRGMLMSRFLSFHRNTAMRSCHVFDVIRSVYFLKKEKRGMFL